MSNIKGVFFPNQVIPSKALGAFAAKTISDGVLAGCDISYAGTALTIGNGYFIACGRVMEISEDVSLAITGATSGYARVSVLVDTTKTATKETFEQADFCVEYSATADGFASLYDENVNMDGTLYQLQLCVVSLSTAGITGMVEEPRQAAGIRIVTLWENADCTASFPGQKLSIPGLSAYEGGMFIFEHIYMTTYWTARSDSAVLVQNNDQRRVQLLHTNASNDYIFTLHRYASVDFTSEVISITDCSYGSDSSTTQTKNDYCVPTRISVIMPI